MGETLSHPNEPRDEKSVGGIVVGSEPDTGTARRACGKADRIGPPARITCQKA